MKIKVLLLNCLVRMHKRARPKIRPGLSGIYLYQKGYLPMYLLKDRGIGSTLVMHLSLTNSRFCGFHLKMNHFEAQLMVSSRVVNSKVLRMAIQFEYFF